MDSVTEGSIANGVETSQTTHFPYDKLNRLVSVTDPANGVTRFDYDLNGNRCTITDPKGNVTRFKYDLDDHLDKKIYPDGTYEL